MSTLGKFRKDMVGQKFGWLIVLDFEQVHKPTGKSKPQSAHWLCRCTACGKLKVVEGRLLRKGKIKSCGCRGKCVDAKR